MLVILAYFSGVFRPAAGVEVGVVSTIFPSQTFTVLNASGYVVAQRKAAVASKITSRLTALIVEEGSRVKKGDILARLESEDSSAFRDQAAANLNVSIQNLEQTRAELHDAKLAVDRNRELIDRGFIARNDYDSSDARHKKAVASAAAAEAQVKAARAALKGADISLEYALIRAPFDAVVLTKNADVGDIVTPLGAAANAKASVVTLADMDSLQVEADVSESNLELVKKGQPCEIQLDAFPDLRFRGQVHMVVPTADRTKATVMIKVSFIDKDVRILPEMSAKVAFLSRPVTFEEQKPRTAISPSAIVERNGRKTVFKIDGDVAAEVPVKAGGKLGDMIEVIDGVKTGDKVVLKPSAKLKNGMRVRTVEK
jgi:RND family efflux transporter MFP subunit